ncbi:hypothetical protein LMG28614_06854 [Paraburkholderia ultramafica]|uniref:Pirin family protein n=1 Tax=Paraburkholderia ultramafica TaxID=1544867 RepID=A0A6S7CFY7_9BURK|nr:pirin family protein [Paraburkholderia ultramafica]CAB3808654.1 hypothetical protein LMG28614_06854 [Paraburkholderia ultramafica]
MNESKPTHTTITGATHSLGERFPTRPAEVGRLPIRRALPNRHKKTVGAWCFLDHAGPVRGSAEAGMHVGPHPHIGLQTLTWMIDGSVLHRDSLGYEQVVLPGQVNLMTAGRGITHAEDTVSDGSFHAVQLWIALPDAERNRLPSFQNYANLPIRRDGGFEITVLAGTAWDLTSPAEVHSPLVGLDFASVDVAELDMPLDPKFEHAILVVSGELTIEAESLEPDVLLHIGTGRDKLKLQTTAACRFIIVGGVPFDEEILIWWNFVARTEKEMVDAVIAWNEHRRFEDVPSVSSPRLQAPTLPPTWR